MNNSSQLNVTSICVQLSLCGIFSSVMGKGTIIVDIANVTQWFREGLMSNFADGLKGVFANLQWAESEVPNRLLLDVFHPSFCFYLG